MKQLAAILLASTLLLTACDREAVGDKAKNTATPTNSAEQPACCGGNKPAPAPAATDKKCGDCNQPGGCCAASPAPNEPAPSTRPTAN